MKICKYCGNSWVYHDNDNTYRINCKCGRILTYPYFTYEAAVEALNNNENAIGGDAHYCPQCHEFFVAPIQSNYDSSLFITYYSSTCPKCNYVVEWDDVYWR